MKNRTITITLFFTLIFLVILPNIGLADYPDGYYNVGRIIDGETFELTDGKSVRLIGIDTAEIGDTCSSQATNQLSSLIEGESVYLERDVSETDVYGRLLRHVYVNGTFVNYKLVYDGYAYAFEYPPDTKYTSLLSDAENNAQSHERGCCWYAGCINCDGDSTLIVSCFIATAAHGSPIDPHVNILREFRDIHLLTNELGQRFVRIYYSYSPAIAEYISKHESLKAFARLSLLPIIGLCWITLKIGPASTMTMLIILFGGGSFCIIRFKRKEKMNNK
jgi:micrococcal nuclease